MGQISSRFLSAVLGSIRPDAPNVKDEFVLGLFGAQREGGITNISFIWVIPPAGDGVAIAIRDRLQRAAFEGGSLR